MSAAARGSGGRTRIWLSSAGGPVAPEDARISVFDRGFLYGDSVYETLRTAGGHLVEWQAHVDRLHRSAEGIGLELPFDEPTLRAAVRETLDAAGNTDSRVRIVVTRGTGPMMLDVRGTEDPQLVIFVQPHVELEDAAYARGVAAHIIGAAPVSHPGLKTGNYLPNILALKRAIELRGDDAIVCNREGEVAEGATSNVFMVRGGELLTPPIEAGLLQGITRERVLGLCAELGLVVHERRFTPDELRAADEVFLTSSVRGVMPVTRLDGAVISGGKPGPLTAKIMAANRAYLAEIARVGPPAGA